MTYTLLSPTLNQHYLAGLLLIMSAQALGEEHTSVLCGSGGTLVFAPAGHCTCGTRGLTNQPYPCHMQVWWLPDGAVHHLQDFERLLPAVKAEQLPDLLRVACNNPDGHVPAMRLLQEDGRRLKVLGADNMDKHGQQVAARLICELMETCIKRSHVDIVTALVALPAAQLLGKLVCQPLA